MPLGVAALDMGSTPMAMTSPADTSASTAFITIAQRYPLRFKRRQMYTSMAMHSTAMMMSPSQCIFIPEWFLVLSF